MSRARYPLAAARALRDHELEAAKSELARSTEALADAEAALSHAEEALSHHRGETRAIAERESERDAVGRSAAEVLGAQAYAKRRREEEAALRRRLDDAAAAVAAAREAVETARAALVAAHAAHQAVERHHARWETEARKADERRAEADLDGTGPPTRTR